MHAIEVRSVHRAFAGNPPVQALAGVSFVVQPGEILGLLGVNGAGKTTLLKILSTLLYPSSGGASICGYDVVRQSRQARGSLSVVFGGERGLYGRLSALENLMFLASLHGIRRHLRERSLRALAEVGLAERARSRVETFSKGMRQRLHLACGLVVDAPVLLLDEPTVGLDVAEAARVREVVRTMARQGTAIVLTSHYPADIDALADRVVLLQRGIVTHDLPAAVFRRQAGFVAEVVVRGVGAPPSITSGNTGVIDVDDGSWQARLRVKEWTGDSVGQLAAMLSTVQVTDIEIQPAGVDTVLLSVTGQSPAP